VEKLMPIFLKPAAGGITNPLDLKQLESRELLQLILLELEKLNLQLQTITDEEISSC
jgi:hypothetical protein